MPALFALCFVSLPLLLAQLPLPSKHTGLISSLFCLGNHSFSLICPRYRSPRQNIFGLKLQNPLGRFNRAVKIFLGVIGLRQAMKRVGEFRIEFERAIVFRDRLIQFPVAEEVNPGVVVVFRGHFRVIAHRAILSSPIPC